MLVASGLIEPGWEALSDPVVTHNPVAREGQLSTPGGPTPASVPSGGWFGHPRQADSTFPFHLAVPRPASAFPRLPGFVSGPKSFPSTRPLRLPETGLPTARLSLHLRFAKSPPGIRRGVFSDRARGITAGSFGCVFPFNFRGFPLPFPVRRYGSIYGIA